MEVVVVGSCNMDLISYIPQLPMKGQTIHGTKFQTGFGGKGANQCVMAAKLGAKCAMIGKVGQDDYGRGFKTEFQRLGVNTDYLLTTCEASTGVASCLVDENGSSAIIIISAANMLLTPGDIKELESVISQSKVVICQLEISEETTLAALRLAKKHGVTTIFNPAPKQEGLSEDIYGLCDYFCPNETEVSERPVETVEEAGEAAQVYLDKGCKNVVVTLGEKGCTLVTSSDRRVKHIPCVKVNAIDTTGAGDAFVGSLAYYIARSPDMPIEEKIRRASRIASQSVTREGTQSSYPGREEIDPSLLT